MGILARPGLRAGRMPTPQENFEDLFICKSLREKEVVDEKRFLLGTLIIEIASLYK
jgi:hypothetical protein